MRITWQTPATFKTPRSKENGIIVASDRINTSKEWERVKYCSQADPNTNNDRNHISKDETDCIDVRSFHLSPGLKVAQTIQKDRIMNIINISGFF